MKLDGRLGRSKRRPVEQAQAQIDGAGVQRIDRVVQIDAERIVCVEFARAPDQQGGQVRPDAPVARFVGVGQRRALDRRANPMAYSLPALADRLASMSRRLSRQVSCAKAIARNCSAHDNVRSPALPPWRCTMRAKLGQGTNSMTCVKKRLASVHAHSSRLSTPGSYAILERRSSNRHQLKSACNPHQCLISGAGRLI